MKDVYWIGNDEPSLAIVARPRGDGWLEDDLSRLKRGGVDVLVSLVEPEEAVFLGLANEAGLAEGVGLDFISYPIPDRTTPGDEGSFRTLTARLVNVVRTGKRVGTHCRGCIGRSTVVTAAVLIQLGIEPPDALKLIQDARGCSVPDTPEQLDWILSFRSAP